MKHVLVLLTLVLPLAAQDAKPQPRVFLQAASHGNVWAARRDQSMEMAKDFTKNCPDVKVTILQTAADYTVILNHIEVGLFGRDNQFQVANKEGDMLGGVREKGGINGGVKAACAVIMSDWQARSAVAPAAGPAAAPAVAPSPAPARPDPAPAPTPTAPSIAPAPAPAPVRALVEPAPSPQPPAPLPQSSRHSTGAGMKIDALGVRVTLWRAAGADITDEAPGGVAALARLHPGDVINAVDGKPVKTPMELAAELANRPAGDKVRIGYMLHGEWQSETTVLLAH